MIPYLHPPCSTSFTVNIRSQATSACKIKAYWSHLLETYRKKQLEGAALGLKWNNTFILISLTPSTFQSSLKTVANSLLYACTRKGFSLWVTINTLSNFISSRHLLWLISKHRLLLVENSNQKCKPYQKLTWNSPAVDHLFRLVLHFNFSSMTLSFWLPSGFSYLCSAPFTRPGAGPGELPT